MWAEEGCEVWVERAEVESDVVVWGYGVCVVVVVVCVCAEEVVAVEEDDCLGGVEPLVGCCVVFGHHCVEDLDVEVGGGEV